MANTDSILGSIKSMLSLTEEAESFDPELILHINSVFPELHQLGIDGAKNFEIEDDSSKWTDVLGDRRQAWVKSFVFYKVKLAFDPPQTANAVAAIQEELAHLTWRINLQAETEALNE